ncbi:MAG: hypothetical protein U0167_17395 [bacterium]
MSALVSVLAAASLVLSAFASALVPPSSAAQAPPTLTAGLPPGPYPVGFHREWLIDSSRVFERSAGLDSLRGPVGRPLRIDVWYPAADADEHRTAVLRDYLYAKAPDAYFASANGWIERWDESSYRRYAQSTRSTFDAMMALRTLAHLDAAVRPGRHPLVMYSGGWYNRAPDNVALAEYLAGYGYVVAAVPQLGTGLWTGDLSSNPAALETQMRDVETCLGALIAHDWIDRTHVAAMGYSIGGIVALLLEGRDPLIDVVVGLDPSYGDDPGLVLSSPYFSMYRNRRPLLTLRSGHETYVARDRSAVLAAMPLTDRYTADVGRGTHGDFGDDVVIEAALSLVRDEPRGTSEGAAAYRATATAARRFLDGTLRGVTAALDTLASPPDPVLRMTKTPAAPIPSSDEWLDLLRREETNALVQRADTLAAKYPDVPVVIERDLNRAGYRLLPDRPTDAVRVFRFNALTHSASANAYDSLAEACAAVADRPGEIEAYRNVLRALPADASLPADAKDRMRASAEAKLRELDATSR